MLPRSLSPALQQPNRSPPVQAMGGTERLKILFPQAERKIKAFRGGHCPNLGSLTAPGCTGDRLHFSSLAPPPNEEVRAASNTLDYVLILTTSATTGPAA